MTLPCTFEDGACIYCNDTVQQGCEGWNVPKDAALRKAAQAVVDRWDTPLWKDVPATAEYINKLREALK